MSTRQSIKDFLAAAAKKKAAAKRKQRERRRKIAAKALAEQKRDGVTPATAQEKQLGMQPTDRLLKRAEAAALAGVSESLLQLMQHEGRGPPYTNPRTKRAGYRLGPFLEWFARYRKGRKTGKS